MRDYAKAKELKQKVDEKEKSEKEEWEIKQ